ncbi:ArsA family ATPase [Microcoleus sp. bin38.metabat.b11b12b14.051]|uniref:Get3/ArsA fold putative tail anchor-mediating ATPase NosAFP n=1 Tax=Microcoleus sp. bin38.metabat.b11b12b14.051 TaxID=2742709 RepID=UPI0025D9868C|nr:ArsA family ATPase [Microcoleus sp. bin38.metabat.b11b12b14.051]
MALILTFLGKGGTGRSTIAIATAKKYAAQGKRVLLLGQDPGPALSILLGVPLTLTPQEIAPNLKAVQVNSAPLLERRWDEVKQLEAQYVRTPFFKQIYGQELGVLPGMDSALALNELREYDDSKQYDVIVYDGSGGMDTLRMLGMPEILSWYIRRFRQAFVDSDLGKNLAVSPFIQPIVSTVLAVDMSGDNAFQSTKQVDNLLDKGKDALADPNRTAAYLVTTPDASAIATARYLWGSSQQVSLTVGGVIVNQAAVTETIAADFAPLTAVSVPTHSDNNWQPLIDALPDFSEAAKAPKPININTAQRLVSLFLPGFDKKEIKLIQSGPEVTIEAGDQRRNILLPPQLTGKSVTGAKFQNGYLIVSF